MAKINKSTMISVVAGLAVFGLIKFVTGKLPTNAITQPVKKVVDVVSN